MKQYSTELLNTAQNYTGTFREFAMDAGWQDWMADLLQDAGRPTQDGEELSEVQCDLINEYLQKVWNEGRHQKIDVLGKTVYDICRDYDPFDFPEDEISVEDIAGSIRWERELVIGDLNSIIGACEQGDELAIRAQKAIEQIKAIRGGK